MTLAAFSIPHLAQVDDVGRGQCEVVDRGVEPTHVHLGRTQHKPQGQRVGWVCRESKVFDHQASAQSILEPELINSFSPSGTSEPVGESRDLVWRERVLHIEPLFLPVDIQHTQCPGRFFILLFTGDQSKYDLRYTQESIYCPLSTNNIWSNLLRSPEIEERYKVGGHKTTTQRYCRADNAMPCPRTGYDRHTTNALATQIH